MFGRGEQPHLAAKRGARHVITQIFYTTISVPPAFSGTSVSKQRFITASGDVLMSRVGEGCEIEGVPVNAGGKGNGSAPRMN